MIRLQIILALGVFAILSPKVLALDVDQKLTLRVLKVTNSQKTILVNRGTEDGLVEGDHAKFFLSIGVVARGKVVKISPTRSVWGLYRVVNADYIKKDSVMNLKITEPMKISSDETKAVVGDDQLAPGEELTISKLGIPLAEGAEDMTDAALSEEEKKKLELMQVEAADEKIADKNLEIWGQVSFLNSSSKVTNDIQTLEASGNITSTYLRFGGEYYFAKEKDWYSNLSVNLNFAMLQSSALSYNGQLANVNANEYGGGLAWHFLGRPEQTNKLYPFISLAMITGAVSDKEANPTTGLTSEATGSRSGMAYGLGFKWYAKGGWGVRAEVQMVSLTDQLTSKDAADVKFKRTLSGQRALVGLSYRW